VLTGSTRAEQIGTSPYRPTRVCSSIADVVPLVAELAPPDAPPVGNEEDPP
jgi:NagD protein